VDPAFQGRGVGRGLMAFAETGMFSAGGRLAVVETSGTDRYAATLGFYEHLGYERAASVRDFYAPGDDKIIYTKHLSHAPAL